MLNTREASFSPFSFMHGFWTLCLDFLVRDVECLGEHTIGQLTGNPEERHGNEADVERAVEDEDESGMWARARRVQTPRRVIDAGDRDAERAHPKDLLAVGWRDELIIRFGHDVGEEVFSSGRFRFVWDLLTFILPFK